ncbi:MAG: tail fiber assembly protein [Patescibacteria group bacterium]
MDRYFVDKDGYVYRYDGELERPDPEITEALAEITLARHQRFPFPLPADWPRFRAFITSSGEVYVAEAPRNEADKDISCRLPKYHVSPTYITPSGDCYNGDRQSEEDIEVPPKPPFHRWDGQKWAFDIEVYRQEYLRPRRNALLAATDWTDLPSAPLTAEQKAAWQTYRQALRDLPEKTTSAEVAWPEMPMKIQTLPDLGGLIA